MDVNSDPLDWKALYAAALFEDDRSKAAARVAEAESAMVLRARALCISPGRNMREAVELDQSLRMLNLLKICMISEVAKKSRAA